MRRTLQDIARIFAILASLTRWGAGPALRVLGRRPVDLPQVGARLRHLLEREGLLYRKLGQYLAMRVDLLHPDICRELDRLFESSAPMPFEQVRSVVEDELGDPLERRFVAFDPHAIGAASVAQVHRATTFRHGRVAVKVQRVGVAEHFLSEARSLRRLCLLIDQLRVLGSLSLTELLDEFTEFTGRELDFRLEGRTADRLRAEAGRFGQVPQIYWDLTTTRVLTMEFVEGVSLLQLCESVKGRSREPRAPILPGVDIDVMVHRLADECFHQFFDTGFFHGDPHPANILIRSDGSFVFIDFGIFGELSPAQLFDLRRYIRALGAGRFGESARAYLRMCRPGPQTDVAAAEQELTAVLRTWFDTLRNLDASVERRHMGHWQGVIATVMQRHGYRFRPSQLLIWRAMVTLDTTALRLPVRFDVLGATNRFFDARRNDQVDAVMTVLNPWRWLSQGVDLGVPLGRLPGLSRRVPPRVRQRRDGGHRRDSNTRTGQVVIATVGVGVVVGALHVTSSGLVLASLVMALGLVLASVRGRQ